MKYHHLFASICSPYHLFYTVRFAMCIPFTDHIAPPRSPIASRDMRYDIRDISFTFVAIGQYMDLHLNIVHTREIWNRFIDFFTVIWWCMENTFQQYFLFYIFFSFFSDKGENRIPMLGLHICIIRNNIPCVDEGT